MPTGNNKTSKILQSLDDTGKLKAPDFFYTRLQARMEKELLNAPKPFLLLRPALLATCLLILLVFNITALVTNKEQTSQANKGAATLEIFASEYNMDTSGQLYE